MKDVYFNNFKIVGKNNSIYYRKPTFEEIYSMLINDNKKIIIESVFNKDLFIDLFNSIENSSMKFFTTNDLMEYFPIKSKPFKILRKNKNQNLYKLYIVNDDLTNKEKNKELLTNICADKVNINDEDIKLIWYGLSDANALFTPLNIKKDLSIIWLHKNKCTIEDFQHEFIHYLEWIKQFYASKFNIDETNFEEEETFKQIFKIYNEDDIEYLLQKEEYQTLINDFLNELAELKDKYFPDWKGLRFARYISSNLLKGKNETVSYYLEHIKNFEYFDFLNSKDSFGFPMVIAYNCMNFKIMNIKNHIFGKFN